MKYIYRLRDEVAKGLEIPSFMKIFVKPNEMKIEDYAPVYFSILYDC